MKRDLYAEVSAILDYHFSNVSREVGDDPLQLLW
jgi:hypothetical protein